MLWSCYSRWLNFHKQQAQHQNEPACGLLGFDKILEVIKDIADKEINAKGNYVKRGTVPKFSDIEVIALSVTAGCLSASTDEIDHPVDDLSPGILSAVNSSDIFEINPIQFWNVM